MLSSVARIYQPAKTAMQSGRANTQDWLLEFEPDAEKVLDPLMGWTGSSDTQTQVRIKFRTAEEAVDFARRNNLPYEVAKPRERKLKIRTYAENFR